MQINNYLDSTYLKTAEQASISEQETEQKIIDLVNEAIQNNFVLVMLRPKFVAFAKQLIAKANAKVTVGTVIGFHEGTDTISEKIATAKTAIVNGADDLDFVINFEAFKKGEIDLVKNEVLQGTEIGLKHGKIVKWIIEIAALNKQQITEITQLIRNVVVANFKENDYKKVFVKSSTGFYKTKDDKPAGATFEAMEIIVKNATPLSAKAAGGVKNFEDAVKMVNLGVSRIGTSSALKIYQGKQSTENY